MIVCLAVVPQMFYTLLHPIRIKICYSQFTQVHFWFAFSRSYGLQPKAKHPVDLLNKINAMSKSSSLNLSMTLTSITRSSRKHLISIAVGIFYMCLLFFSYIIIQLIFNISGEKTPSKVDRTTYHNEHTV